MNTENSAQAFAIAAEDGEIDLQDLRRQCLAKIAEGGGEVVFMLSASLNGKGAAQQCRRDAEALFVIVQRAIDINTGRAVSLTYADLSGLR